MLTLGQEFLAIFRETQADTAELAEMSADRIFDNDEMNGLSAAEIERLMHEEREAEKLGHNRISSARKEA